MKYTVILSAMLFLSLLPKISVSQTNGDSKKELNARSRFNNAKYEYEGDAGKQATYLLRKVQLGGIIKEKSAPIDSSFLILLVSATEISVTKLKSYLDSNEIRESEIGGSLELPLSFIIHKNEKKYATYFVIHDVSAPVYYKKFASNINSPNWPYNKHSIWAGKRNHIYIMRDGSSKTVVDFSTGWRATKMENNLLGVKSRGLFLHIELIQPRKYPPGNEKNAKEAPTPGFTNKQYERLALTYIVASTRKKEWLIPAFHACIDEGLEDAHDDPQNFELKKFSDEVIRLLELVKK